MISPADSVKVVMHDHVLVFSHQCHQLNVLCLPDQPEKPKMKKKPSMHGVDADRFEQSLRDRPLLLRVFTSDPNEVVGRETTPILLAAYSASCCSRSSLSKAMYCSEFKTKSMHCVTPSSHSLSKSVFLTDLSTAADLQFMCASYQVLSDVGGHYPCLWMLCIYVGL